MRKTIYILFAILGMSLFAGCDDDKKDNNTPLAKLMDRPGSAGVRRLHRI